MLDDTDAALLVIAGAQAGRLFLANEKCCECRHDDSDGEVGNAHRHQGGGAESLDECAFRELEREDRQRGVHGGQKTGRRHVENSVLGSLDAVDAHQDGAAHGKHQVHGIGESGDQDQRRDDVDEKIEAEVHGADCTERPQNGDRRTSNGNQRQGDATEEQVGDDEADEEAQAIVDQAVALHGIADLELHDRGAGQFGVETTPVQLVVDDLLNAADDFSRPFLDDKLAIERDDHQRQFTVVRQEFAGNDVVGLEPLDELIVVRSLGQLIGNERRCIAVGVGLVARREHGNQAIDAFGKVQLDGQIGEALEVVTRQQRLAVDDDQDIELAGGKAPVDLLVLAEFLCIGAKQLGQRIVDFQPRYADHREGGQNHDQKRGQGRCLECDEAEPVQTE